MRVFTDVTLDKEFEDLGLAGFFGSLNDRQFWYLRGQGRLGALADMQGGGVGLPPTVVFPVLISGLIDLGEGDYIGQIGSTLTAVSCAVSGATIVSSTWRWLRNGVAISGATATSYTLVAGDDLTDISVEQTPTLSFGSVGAVTSISFPVLYPAPSLVGSLSSQNFAPSTGTQTYTTAGAFSVVTGTYGFSPATTGVSINPSTGVVSVDTGATGPLAGVSISVSKSNSGGSISTGFLLSVSSDTADDRVLRPATTGTSYIKQDIGTTGSGTSTGDIMLTALIYLGSGETFVDGEILSIGNTANSNAWLGIGMKRATMSNSGTPGTTAPDLADPVGPGWFVVTFTAESDQRRYRLLRNADSAINGSILSTTNYNAWANQTGKYISIGARVRGPTPTVSNQFRHRLCGIMWVRGTGAGTTFVARAQALHDWIYNGGNIRNPSSAVLASFEMSAVGTDAANLPFFRFSRAGAATFDVAEPAALDIFGSLDTWVATGNSMTWDTPGPPWPLGASVANLTSATVASGSTMTVVATLPPGINWGATRTVDVAKMDLRSAYGPGRNPRVISTSTAIAANVCTVTCTLVRPIYLNEPLFLNLSTNWITDNLANGGAPITDAACVNSSPTAWPATWDGASFGRCAVTFSPSVAAEFAIPNYGNVTHRPTTITEHYPAYDTGGAQGHVLHGAEFNPIRRAAGGKQGFTLANSVSYGINYDVAFVASFPRPMVNGDALIKSYSNIDKLSNGGGPRTDQPLFVQEYLALNCTTAAAAANQFPPIPVLGDTGDARVGFETFDHTTATLPSYSLATITPRPTIQTIINHLKVFNPSVLCFSNVIAKRFMTPSFFTLAGGYGTSVCDVANVVGCYIIGDDPIADRRELLRLAMNIGRQVYWIVSTSTQNKLNSDGGQNQGWLLYMALYLSRTGRLAELATLEAACRTGELEQSFRWTPDLINRATVPHTNAGNDDWPMFSLLRTLTSVNAGTLQISFADSYDKDIYNGMLLRRPSDGFEATVVGSSVTAGVRTLTLDAWPGASFAIGNTVHGKFPYTIVDGDPEWTIRGLGLFRMYNPKMDAVYRTPENKWLGEVVAMQALGIWHSSQTKARDYVVRTETPNIPTAIFNLPSHRSSYGSDLIDGPFYDLHYAAISLVPQTVG